MRSALLTETALSVAVLLAFGCAQPATTDPPAPAEDTAAASALEQ